MKVKSHFVFLIFGLLGLLISETSCAKGKGDCVLIDEKNQTISYDEWENGIQLDPIDDIQKVRTMLLYYRMKGSNYYVYDIYANGEEYNNYVSLNYDPTSDGYYDLRIFIGGHFDEYENRETSTTMTLRLELSCPNFERSSIEFRVPIIDSNNHDPEFLDGSYKFALPMPIPKMYVSEDIVIRDVDLTNEHITLSIDENENSKGRFILTPATRDPEDKKKYITKLIASTLIDLEEDLTFTITATDSGSPPRTTTTTVSIIVDEENSVPRFVHPLYTADLRGIDYKTVDNILVQFTEGSVTVTRGYQGVDNFEIRECSYENKEHLKLSHGGGLSGHGITTYVELNNLTEEFLKQKIISVVLAAAGRHVETSTVLQIILPEISIDEVSETVCPTNENTLEAVPDDDDSINGYMIATVLLSLTIIGLIGFIIFLFLRKGTFGGIF